jgi:hypothetical protein
MKTAILAYLMVTCFVETRGQSVFSNSTNSALEKVIQDYPNRFSNIKGSLVSETTRATNYESNVKIPGSLSCTIAQTNYSDKKLLSWKAELFVSSSFSDASDKYAELFKQIKNSVIKVQGTKTYILNGQYYAPDHNKNYQSIILNLLPASGELRNVKVEISLESQSGKWKILLSIFDDRDEQLVRNDNTP